ncbi:MAG TPA: tetratricopeptide repeat protein [Vicinamibacterales bacterium]|nr:tetratricopeptide repeat protein [Vicinamibacterales bacterium]
MKPTILAMAVLAAVGVGLGTAYQTAARQRHYRVLLARGDAALADGDTFAAIEAYSGAIAFRSDSMVAHLRLGETYLHSNNLEEAAREFRLASRLDPAAVRPLEELGDVTYQQQNYARAVDAYQHFLRLDDTSARVSYKLALAWYREGEFERSLQSLRDTIRLDPRMGDAYYLLAVCLRERRGERNDSTAEARVALEHALALMPGSIPVREELADVYASAGRVDDELEQLQVLASLDRDHIERQIAIGLAHARAARTSSAPVRARHEDLAVLTLSGALERSPDDPLVYRALGQVWLDIALGRQDRVALNKAREALARVVSTPSAATSDALTLYGRALMRAGEVDLAERTLRQATERFPVEPSAFMQYATVAELSNRYEAARRALIQYGLLVVNDADFVSRASRIASLSLRLNDAPDAVHWLQQASSAAPEDLHLVALLADAQLRAGDRAAARATVAAGLKKDSGNVVLLQLQNRAR